MYSQCCIYRSQYYGRGGGGSTVSLALADGNVEVPRFAKPCAPPTLTLVMPLGPRSHGDRLVSANGQASPGTLRNRSPPLTGCVVIESSAAREVRRGSGTPSRDDAQNGTEGRADESRIPAAE